MTKREKLEEAMNEISDKHLSEAVTPRKKHTLRWVSAIAAVLAIVIAVNLLGQPMILRAQAVAVASESRAAKRPDYQYYDLFKTQEEYRIALDLYLAQQNTRSIHTDTVTQTAADFFKESSQLILESADGGNRVWSPINGYIALSMLAELTDGNTRQQLLDLLNTPDTNALRAQVSAVWENVYTDNGKEISTLSNSVWLDKELSYSQQAMDDLAHHYYASVYQGDLGSKAINKDLQAWLNKNTGNLLTQQAGGIQLDPLTVFTLASTVYLQSKWSDDFSKSNNTTEPFHTPNGDVSCTFMNKKEHETYYYWGDSFGAVSLGLKNGCTMWFFLPDADKSVDDVLAEGQYLDTVAAPYQEDRNAKYMKVNLSVPKFDVSYSADLTDSLKTMGVTEVFDASAADFSPAFSEDPAIPVWVSGVEQAARVAIDEEGVVAASYVVIIGAGAAPPPEEIIDFILDRPFVFVIAKDNLPLFTGIVNNP